MAKLVTKKEYSRRRKRYQVTGDIIDVLVTFGCLILAFICIVLIVRLIQWLRSDIDTSFGLFDKIFNQTIKTNPTPIPSSGYFR